jgi:hypothetical protein
LVTSGLQSFCREIRSAQKEKSDEKNRWGRGKARHPI